MSIPTLRVSAPRDLLALVPYRLGYRPRRSIVLVCLRGRSRRVGLVARVDLPSRPDHLALCAQRLVAHAVADGAAGEGGAVLVVYADAAVAAAADSGTGREAGSGSGDVLTAVSTVADSVGLDLVDAWQVTQDRYLPLLCGDPQCCRPEGEPLSDLDGSVVAAEMVALGCVVGPDAAAALGDLTPAEDGRRDRVDQVAKAERRRAPRGGASRRTWRSRQVTAWRREVAATGAGADGEVPPEAAGRLLAGLEDPIVRDAVMLSLVPGSALAPESLAAHGPSDVVLAHLDRVFDAQDAVHPDEAVLDAAGRVLRSLVRQGSGVLPAPPLGLLAWMAWWLGDGAASRALVERSLQADPGHRLAQLLGEALDRGVPPGWALRDRALDVAGQSRG